MSIGLEDGLLFLAHLGDGVVSPRVCEHTEQKIIEIQKQTGVYYLDYSEINELLEEVE